VAQEATQFFIPSRLLLEVVLAQVAVLVAVDQMLLAVLVVQELLDRVTGGAVALTWTLPQVVGVQVAVAVVLLAVAVEDTQAAAVVVQVVHPQLLVHQ
jgi:hypothetical protein